MESVVCDKLSPIAAEYNEGMHLRTLLLVISLLPSFGAWATSAPTLQIDRIEIHPATGAPRLVVFAPAKAFLYQGSSGTERALEFFSLHGSIFGIEDADNELQAVSDFLDRLGHRHTTLAQIYRGVPVLGGLLRLHEGPFGRVRVVNGLFVPGIDIDPEPSFSSVDAQIHAFDIVADKISVFDLPWLEAGSPTLMVLRTHLVRGVPGRDHLVWEVEVGDGRAWREILYLDAHHGKIVDRLSGIHSIYRQVHKQFFDNTLWREGDDFPFTGSDEDTNTETNELILGSQDIYTLFANLSDGDFLSWNGHHAAMHSIQDFEYDDCPNAFWNGSTTNFCVGMVADDIVSHEWTHAYTTSTHNLFFRFQPGAINEAYSDIFGEIADRLNGRGSDEPDVRRADGGCPSNDSSLRWQIGEDSVFGTFRDMWNPACFGDPTRVSDGRYFCGEGDRGGVHTNSGVPNHAFALATDGGGFNDVEIAGTGLIRSAHIWWRAMSVYQVPTTDFPNHADLIELACEDLIGADLIDLETGALSPDRITGAHCTEVAKAMNAVEMRLPPDQCAFEPLLASSPPSFPGSRVIFSEDFSADPFSGGAPWSVSNVGVYEEYDPRDWVWVNDPPEGSDGDGAAFAIDSVFIGDCNPGSDDQSGVMYLDSPPVTIPPDSREVFLVVDHYVATEGMWDGGLIEVSVEGRPFLDLPLSSFRFNPYRSALETNSDGNDNPLAGRWAFHGADGGSVRGSWGQTQASLQGIAGPGETVVIRFALGVDGCNGLDGWYLDRVQLIEDGPPPRQGTGRSGG